jgi:prolyl 4-hydroxylase
MSASPDPALSRRAEALAAAGQLDQAFRLLEQAINAGDGYAAVTLADWRMSGGLIRRDLAAARDLFGRAAELGIAEAEPVYIALLANGAGGIGRQWGTALRRLEQRALRDAQARIQSQLLAAMQIDQAGDPLGLPTREVISENPTIAMRRDFLSRAECRYLIDTAIPQLEPAVVIHPQTGQPILDPIRKTQVAMFPFVAEDPVIHAINRRIAAASGSDYAEGEPLQVLCYGPGDEYKLHSDALPPGPIQRKSTLLVWLNEDYECGETDFPRAGLRLRGRTGDAVHFQNLTATGEMDPMAVHAGLPPRQGRKFLLSKWIRTAPLDLTGPSGRPF